MRMCARNRLHRRYGRCLSTNWGGGGEGSDQKERRMRSLLHKDPQYDHREEQTPNGNEEESSIGRSKD
jgi:hypothetical protein